jgi:hypothetical protein
MKIAFTICSNNYLAQAKTLGDSIKKTNPDYQFFIGLVDQLSPEIDYSQEIGHTIIPADSIGIPEFDDLWKKYSIIEFNTCVKPFYFLYFIRLYPELEYLYYLDPDTFVFGNLGAIEQEFGGEGNILITPHIITPIQIDDKEPNENIFLNSGIYNLGFLGLRYPNDSIQLLEWWKERTFNLGYDKTEIGLFVDQLWFNLVPLFFKRVVISKHLGLNMAPWNLHERNLTRTNDEFIINNEFSLIFYHFSNYKYTNPNAITTYYTRYSFENTGILKDIYQEYHELLLSNGIHKIEKIKCIYMSMRIPYVIKEQKSSPKKKIKYYSKKIIPSKIMQILRSISH